MIYHHCETSLELHLFDREGGRPDRHVPSRIFIEILGWFQEFVVFPIDGRARCFILSWGNNKLSDKLNPTCCKLSD